MSTPVLASSVYGLPVGGPHVFARVALPVVPPGAAPSASTG